MKNTDICFEYTADEKYEPLHLQLVGCLIQNVKVYYHISSFDAQSDVFPDISSACHHDLENHCSRNQGNFSIFQSEIFLVVLEALCCQNGDTFLKIISEEFNIHAHIPLSILLYTFCFAIIPWNDQTSIYNSISM